ncbi:MAG TPA: hypothetical protein VG013_30640 [Gemmataceae bacterium]|jgi:hypothetical protein|nr:hypothetical protein [Gemmataceae bacterium]
MIAQLAEIELHLLDSMSREQVLAMLLQRNACIPVEMSEEWLSLQCTDRLRLLLLAAKLIEVVGHPERCLAAGR